MRTDAARLVDEQLICGMHVHVAMPERETAVRVLNRLRPWLPLLVALGGNSPLWRGQDTGFASWRTVIFGRWPVTGIPPAFASAADYDARLDALHRAGVIRDRGQVYWLARISERYPTLEVRALDVQLHVEDAQALAGAVRALVATALLEEDGGRPADPPPELLSGALWHASRYGLGGQLVDPVRGEHRDAAAMVKDLLDHIGPALAASGDHELVPSALERLLHVGTGADRQRQALAAGRGRPAALIAYLSDQMDAQ
jgi:carboxylate-amine ligase